MQWQRWHSAVQILSNFRNLEAPDGIKKRHQEERNVINPPFKEEPARRETAPDIHLKLE